MMKRWLSQAGLGLALVLGEMGTAAQAAGDHLITMQNADIRAFIEDVSMVTGRTFLVDPRVQGKVTIASEQSLSPNEVFDVFKNVMRVHGYAVTRSGKGEYRISLMQGAAQDAPFVQNQGYNGQLATTVIKLDNADAAEAAKLIKPMLHPQGVLTANPGGKVLVITDFPENIRKARAIASEMDSDGRVMESIPLTSMSAIEAQNALRDLGGPRPSFKAVAIGASNSLLLEGDAAEVARLKNIVRQMDMPSQVSRGAVSILPLRYADGENIVEILAALLPAYARDGQPQPTVAHEKATNTIIISAESDARAAMEQIVRRLDVRRPQVLVEAIIVEISDTAAKELGVQFAVAGVNNSTTPLFTTNFSRQATNMLTIAGALANDSVFGINTATQEGLRTTALTSLTGSTGGSFGVGGQSGDTIFSAIVNALETDTDSNILSTPFVTTMDNKEASFLVGQEIPVTTGETLGNNNVNPFRTFDRAEVGIKLKVTPQISEGDVIRLDIAQEVSSIAGAATTVASDFITNKRQIETAVLANDGEIIVLGGMIQDDEQISMEKVPGLGDAPLIGNLFRTQGKTRRKTNLMVFLRPTIIRNKEDARPLTDDRLDYMRALDRQQSGRELSKIDTALPPAR